MNKWPRWNAISERVANISPRILSGPFFTIELRSARSTCHPIPVARSRHALLILSALCLVGLATPSFADEGIWFFNNPPLKQANEFVGIIFDGNIQSLVLDCTFSDKQARAVSVDSAAITEAIRMVYGANDLADELEGWKNS